MENIVFCMEKVILPVCGGLNSLMLIQLLILSLFPFLPQKCECAIGSQQMTFILTYPLLNFSPPVFPWWHCGGVEYHNHFCGLAPFRSEQLGLTCLLVITWLSSLYSF